MVPPLISLNFACLDAVTQNGEREIGESDQPWPRSRDTGFLVEGEQTLADFAGYFSFTSQLL